MSNEYLDIAMNKVIEQEVNKVLEDIKAEIEEKREVLMKQGGVFEHSAYGLDYALLIINEYMRGAEND